MTSNTAGDEPDGIEAAVTAFDESRPRLFGIAYRMLGSVAEAEDIVQEAWIRWQGTDRTVVRNPAGFLTTVTTRLALNTAESARVRREQYIGPWLPEPVDTSADPSLGAERAEALESAVLVLLEGRAEVISQSESDTEAYRGALQVVSRDDLLQRIGGADLSDRLIEEQAAILDTTVAELGG